MRGVVTPMHVQQVSHRQCTEIQSLGSDDDVPARGIKVRTGYSGCSLLVGRETFIP